MNPQPEDDIWMVAFFSLVALLAGVMVFSIAEILLP